MIRSGVLRAVAAASSLTLLAAACGDTDEPSDAVASESADGTAADGLSSVSFTMPTDGEAVSNPFLVAFEAESFTIEPAGEVHEGAGHLHVMIDVPCLPAGETIPKDSQHLHFGKGQLEGSIDLDAGEHTLCLQAADGAHTALDLTDEITITVDDSPSVAFVEPASGATVTSPVTVRMAAFNFMVEPAGDVHEGAGHLHLMVDVPCLEPGEAIPKDDQHVHLGKGQTETELTLAPGNHSVCLQAADGAHMALDITRELAFTVEG